MSNKPGDQQKQQPVTRRALTLDAEKYQKMLDSPDMTQDQKSELIEALWTFVTAFMDLNYEVRFLNTCGKDGRVASKSAKTAHRMLPSAYSQHRHEFAAATSAKNKEAS